MRIKNKELRQRRHRKEQVLKGVRKELATKYANKPAPTPVAAKAPAPKKEAAKKEAAKKEAAPKTEAAAKPKKAPAKKKAEAEES